MGRPRIGLTPKKNISITIAADLLERANTRCSERQIYLSNFIEEAIRTALESSSETLRGGMNQTVIGNSGPVFQAKKISRISTGEAQTPKKKSSKKPST